RTCDTCSLIVFVKKTVYTKVHTGVYMPSRERKLADFACFHDAYGIAAPGKGHSLVFFALKQETSVHSVWESALFVNETGHYTSLCGVCDSEFFVCDSYCFACMILWYCVLHGRPDNRCCGSVCKPPSNGIFVRRTIEVKAEEGS